MINPSKGIIVVLSILAMASLSCSSKVKTIDKDEVSRLLFLDARIIERTNNAKLEVGEVKKHPNNPLFKEDKPWEKRIDNLYGNVIFDREEQLFKCWYSPFVVDYSTRGMTLEQRKSKEYVDPDEAREMAICYATSKDGINWIKPSLGLIDYEGSSQNNIIWRGPHGTGIFKDDNEKDPLRRFKAMFQGMAVSFSEDGIHWSDEQKCNGVDVAGDTHNNAFWAPTLRKYVGITRTWGDMGREVARIESENFIDWSKAEQVIKAEDENLQPYAMPTFFYGGVYLGLLAVHNQASDRVHTELAWSPDTKKWNRISPGTPLIPNSSKELDYDYGCVYACANPVFSKEGISLYYGGSDWLHTSWRIGSLSLATLRPDGFAGYVPKNSSKVATIITAAMPYHGQPMSITADVGDRGSVTITVLDENDREIARAKPILDTITDGLLDLKREVKGKNIKLKFELRNAKLYSMTI